MLKYGSNAFTPSQPLGLPVPAPTKQEKTTTSPRQRAALVMKDVPGKGRGIFAEQTFRSGEEVLQFLGELKDVSAFKDLTHALQVGPKAFLSPSGDIDDFVNHSCEPNCGIRDDQGRVVLFALNPIAKGDEITFDYATTQAGGYWRMSCQCGTPSCRKSIGDFSEMSKAQQEFYAKRGAVLPYLLK